MWTISPLPQKRFLSLPERGQTEECQSQEGRRKMRKMASGWGGDQKDLLHHMWMHSGPRDGLVSRSSHPRKALQGCNRTGKPEVGQHRHRSRREMLCCFDLLYLNIYSVLPKSYRHGNWSYLPHNKLFQFLKTGGSLLYFTLIFWFKSVYRKFSLKTEENEETPFLHNEWSYGSKACEKL